MMDEINHLWLQYKLAATRLGVANKMVRLALTHDAPVLLAELKAYRDTLASECQRALDAYDTAYHIAESKAERDVEGMDS
jgi:hypothetical protein